MSGSFLVIFQRLRTGRKKRDSTTGIRCSLSDIYCKFLAVSQASKPIKMLLGGHTRFGRKEPFTRAIEMVVHIGATSQIRLNDPCKAAMRPYVELLRPPVTPSPIGERSIVISVSVCLSARDHIFGTTRPIFTKFLCILPVAVARSSSGGVVIIRYVLPVLWMTSYLLVSQGCSTSPPS